MATYPGWAQLALMNTFNAFNLYMQLVFVVLTRSVITSLACTDIWVWVTELAPGRAARMSWHAFAAQIAVANRALKSSGNAYQRAVTSSAATSAHLAAAVECGSHSTRLCIGSSDGREVVRCTEDMHVPFWLHDTAALCDCVWLCVCVRARM